MRSYRSLACIAVAGATLLGMPAAAQASTVQPADTPSTRLVLTVGYGEGTDQVASYADLVCDPAAGRHPAPGQACDALNSVDGEISQLSMSSRVCTLEYNPVTVAVLGVWRGRTIDQRTTYSNPCQMDRATGPLFRFATPPSL